MRNKLQALLQNLTEQLNFIDLEINDNVMKCEKSIEVITIVIHKVKTLIFKSGFKSEQEEINFFKEIKPLFTSRLTYYNSVYKIETKKPFGGSRIIKK